MIRFTYPQYSSSISIIMSPKSLKNATEYKINPMNNVSTPMWMKAQLPHDQVDNIVIMENGNGLLSSNGKLEESIELSYNFFLPAGKYLFEGQLDWMSFHR